MADKVKPSTSSEVMYQNSGSAPSRECVNITPNDNTDLDPYARSIRVGVAGNVTIQTPRGESVLFVGAGAGEIIPVHVKRLMATGTTATDIVALYG